MAHTMKRGAQLRRPMNALLIALATVAPVAQSSAAPEAAAAQSKGAANPCAPTNPCAPKKKTKKPVDAPMIRVASEGRDAAPNSVGSVPVRFGRADLHRAIMGVTGVRAQRLIRAARGLAREIQQLARSGRSVMHEVLGPQSVAEPWMRYPGHMVEDPRSGSGYFFHSHGQFQSHPDERRHFHVFVRGLEARRSHLLAIAIDAYGLPIRLFTTNRWATGDNWTPAEALLAAAERFFVVAPDSNAVLNRWVTCCVQLFQPQLPWLMYRRDTRLRTLAAGRDMERVFEDRRVDILSECRISVRQQNGGAAGNARCLISN